MTSASTDHIQVGKKLLRKFNDDILHRPLSVRTSSLNRAIATSEIVSHCVHVVNVLYFNNISFCLVKTSLFLPLFISDNFC